MNNEFDWEKPSPAEDEAQGIQGSKRTMGALPNPTVKTLFSVMLWFLPSGFAVLAGIGGDFLLRNHFPTVLCDVIPLLLVSAFTVGTGWYNSFLSEHAHTEHFGTIYRTTKFFCLQLIIIPILGSLLFFLLINSGLIPV